MWGFLRKKLAEEAIEIFIASYCDNTAHAYRGIVSEWCRFLGHAEGIRGGSKKIQAATEIDAYRFLKSQKNKISQDGSVITEGTFARKIGILKKLYNYLRDNRYVESNPFSGIVLKRVSNSPEKRPSSFIEYNDVRKMIEGCSGDSEVDILNSALIGMFFGGALRRSEIVNLDVGDVIFLKNGQVGLYLRKTKNKKNEIQHLPLWASQKVERLVEYRILHNQKNGALMLGTTGKRICDYTIYRRIKKIAKDCGIRGRIHPHAARATSITKMLERNDHRAVMKFSRHSSVRAVETYDRTRYDKSKLVENLFY